MKSLCDEEICACCFEFYCFDSHNNLSVIQLLQITTICQKQRQYFANKSPSHQSYGFSQW